MAKKLRVKQDIGEATQALKAIMQENLSAISDAMIEQIMAAYRRLPASQRFAAINDIKPQGISVYKEALLNALAIIASKSLDKVRMEVPKKKKVRLASIDEKSLRLGEYEKLPPDLRKRVDSMLKLLTGTQISDLEKVIFFQFNSSVDSTDSEELLQKDLTDAANEYVGGNAINGGASASAAQIINEARLAFFLDDKVSEGIEAFEFVNGDPVSPICQDLAGTVFAKDDPNLHRYWPPLHFNCKSYISAILQGNLGNREIEDLKATKTAEKSIQFTEDSIDFILKEIAKPRPGNLQTIIVSKDVAQTAEEAKKIAKDVGAEYLDYDETESSFRFRQRNPSDFEDSSFKSFPIAGKGATLVYGQLKA